MENFKIYTEEEMLDRHIGKIGTKERDAFEEEFNAFLIGEAVKKARCDNNLTQEQLGSMAGVNRTQISMLERGKNTTMATLSKVLRAMGLHANLDIPSVGQYAI